MPTHAEADPAIKQMYINGHFCYSYKFGMITNGLGIVRDLNFYDENYYLEHPEIQVSKKDYSPDEDKSLADSKALLPTLRGFFEKHPLIKLSIFLGDSHLIPLISTMSFLAKMVLVLTKLLSRLIPHMI